MKDLYELLDDQKKMWDDILAPPNFEKRLNLALEKAGPQPLRKKRLTISLISAAVVLFIFVIGMTYPTLAYYGKQILGFNSVMSHNLQALNHAGKGQIINKSYTLKNGIKITLNGVMSDPNEFIAFVTVQSQNHELMSYNFLSTGIAGIWTHLSPSSSYGKLSQDSHSMNFIANFKPTGPFANKHLTYSFTLTDPSGHTETGSILFNYDRNKAMPVTVQKTLHHTVNLDGNQMQIKQLTATPTSTIVTGSFHSTILKGLMDRTPNNWIQLVANGEPVPNQGSSFHSNGINVTFQEQFDSLPQPLTSLQVVVTKAPFHDSKVKKWNLDDVKNGAKLPLQPGTLTVKDLIIKDNVTTLVISVPYMIKIGPLKIQEDGKSYPGKISQAKLNKTMDGPLTRLITYQFNTGTQNGQLALDGFDYMKTYHKVITIPVEK